MLSFSKSTVLKSVSTRLVPLHDPALWSLHSDAALGGGSSGALALQPWGIRFSGVLSSATAGTLMKNSGFCAISSPTYAPPLDLSAFAGLRYKLRSHGRTFVANMKIDSQVEDDLFQAFLLPPARRRALAPRSRIISPYAPQVAPSVARSKEMNAADERFSMGMGHRALENDGMQPVLEEEEGWETVDLLFSDFCLTWRGFIESSERKASPDCVLQLGFLMAEKEPGPFCLDIADVTPLSKNQVTGRKRFDGL